MGEAMAEVPVERRFIGSTHLATLHLWRIAKTTDLDECFKQARELNMIDADNEAFMRRCLELGERMEAGEDPGEPVTDEMVHELQMCVLRLNSADPA